ncbi:DUF3108 domain-containing protein [Pseudocnuella soli]|uniref:DUF3108 domain-containing protein n=1 Tax=Pseudocnuella soli TaxID=2502779 RepID=UPI001404EEA6|nr:DUF3108 domain-containing protein [Pseudocnuella soli]
MSKLRWLLLVLFAAWNMQGKAQNLAFQSGEKISYVVFYNVMGIYVNAGNATFSASRRSYENNDVFHLVGEGVTNTRYDWIFKVRDRYESYFDTQRMQPLKFVRNVHEGDYKKYEEVTFDHHNRVATTTKGVVKVPHAVQDVISSLYFARNLDFSKLRSGDKVPFSMYLDNEVHNMHIRYMGKERIKTRYGTFRAIKLKPLLLKGETFNGGEDMTIWVTDDANHIPVRIESPLTVGSVKVDLMGYQNLKHPFTALESKR